MEALNLSTLSRCINILLL